MSFLGGFSVYPTAQGGMSAPQLQSTCSAATSGVLSPGLQGPHHPITCTSKLYWDEDDTFSCEHSSVPGDDPRSKSCLIHSMALMIIEEAFSYTTMDKLPYDRYEEQ